jgi:hypothetical protein
MNKAKLMFYMKKAIVNDEEGEVEDDERETMTNIRKLLESDREAAEAEMLSFFELEVAWGNLDCDYSEYMPSTEEEFMVKCLAENTTLEALTAPGSLIPGPDGGLGVSAWIKFDVEVKDDANPEEFAEWLEENAGYACCFVCPWGYTESDGDNLYLVEWNGKPFEYE